MRTLIRRLRRARTGLAAGAALLAAGCSPGNSNTPADMATGTPQHLRVVRDMAKQTATVKGILRDETGKAMADSSILGCSAIECLFGKTGMDGSFSIPGLRLGQLVVKTEDDREESPKHAAAMSPTKLMTVNETVDVGELFVPLIPAVTPLPANDMPTPLMIGDGLRLTVVKKDIELALGAEKDLYLGAREVPAERRSKTFDTGGETVVASWSIIPFSTRSMSPMPVKVPVTGLAAGTKVNFRTISELDGASDPPVVGHVDQDGKTASTDPGQGITRLTWLLVTK